MFEKAQISHFSLKYRKSITSLKHVEIVYLFMYNNNGTNYQPYLLGFYTYNFIL